MNEKRTLLDAEFERCWCELDAQILGGKALYLSAGEAYEVIAIVRPLLDNLYTTARRLLEEEPE